MELGARVATIRPKLTAGSQPDEIQHTARVLGRLYDAVECQDMAETLVSAIARSAGIPVYDGLACERHPIAGLASRLGIDAPPAQQRALLLQAALLGSIA
jgi:ornithine carbamoyltransferase